MAIGSWRPRPPHFQTDAKIHGNLFYNICLISITNTVSDGATKTLVLSIEVAQHGLPVPLNLSPFWCRGLKLQIECTQEPIGAFATPTVFIGYYTQRAKNFTNYYISQLLKNVWSQFHAFSVKSRVLEEHSHVFAHAQDFDFGTSCREFKDARVDRELSEIRLHRP